MQAKYKSLVNNTAVFAIGNLLVKLIAFVLMPLYTSVLTTEQYAVSELLNSIIEIVLPIMTLCIIEALYRFSIDEKVDYKAVYMNSLYTVLISAVLVCIGCCIIQRVWEYPYAMAFAGLYASVVFYKLTTQFARGLGHAKIFALSGIINALVLVGANVYLLVLKSGGVSEYLYSFSIAYTTAGIFALVAAKEYRFISIGAGSKALYKEMLHYGVPNIPNMLAWWINSVSSRYVIMYFLGNSLAGMYTAASKLPAIVNLVSSVFQQAWQYSTAKEIEKEDSNSFFSTVYKVYAPLCYISCGLLILLTPLISKILFQKEFYEAWRYVPYLLVAATIGCFSTFFGTFFNAIKKNSVLMVSTVVGAVINVVLNIITVPLFGVMAAAITTLVSYIVVTLIRYFWSQKYVTIESDNIKNAISVFLLITEATLMSFGEGISFGIAGFLFAILLILYFRDMRSMCKLILNKALSMCNRASKRSK